MLKKTKVFFASCFLIAGVSNVQAYTYTLTTFDLNADAAATTRVTEHAGAGEAWFDGAALGVQYYTTLGEGVSANIINVTLSTDQYYGDHILGTPSLRPPVVDYTVLGSNDYGASWTQAKYVHSANVISSSNVRDTNDITNFWRFSEGLDFSTIGVISGTKSGGMTITDSGIWGGNGYRQTGALVEFDSISVPEPAVALLTLLGIIAVGRRKNLYTV